MDDGSEMDPDDMVDLRELCSTSEGGLTTSLTIEIIYRAHSERAVFFVAFHPFYTTTLTTQGSRVTKVRTSRFDTAYVMCMCA